MDSRIGNVGNCLGKQILGAAIFLEKKNQRSRKGRREGVRGRNRPITRSKAKGVRRNVERSETAFMMVVCFTVLSRFNLTSKKIVSAPTCLKLLIIMEVNFIL